MRNKQKPLQNQTTFTVLSGENRGMELAAEFQISNHEGLRSMGMPAFCADYLEN